MRWPNPGLPRARFSKIPSPGPPPAGGGAGGEVTVWGGRAGANTGPCTAAAHTGLVRIPFVCPVLPKKLWVAGRVGGREPPPRSTRGGGGGARATWRPPPTGGRAVFFLSIRGRDDGRPAGRQDGGNGRLLARSSGHHPRSSPSYHDGAPSRESKTALPCLVSPKLNQTEPASPPTPTGAPTHPSLPVAREGGQGAQHGHVVPSPIHGGSPVRRRRRLRGGVRIVARRRNRLPGGLAIFFARPRIRPPWTRSGHHAMDL